jgi:hypothetical protein
MILILNTPIPRALDQHASINRMRTPQINRTRA